MSNADDKVTVRITFEVEGKEVMKDVREYIDTDLATAILLEEKLNKVDKELLDEQKRKLGLK